MIPLKEIRKARKVWLKDIKLNERTIRKIENGDDDVLLSSLKIYLDAVGLKMTISI